MKSEIMKIVKNKNTYISISCLLLLVLLAVVTGLIDYNQNYSLFHRIYESYPNVMVYLSPYQYWVGLSVSNLFSSLYYFIFPLLIAIPIVDSIYLDKYSGHINFALTRMNRFSYFVKKFLITFIFGFILFIIPLLFGVILINIFTGHWDYSTYSKAYQELLNGTADLPDDSFIGQKKTLFSNLMMQSPYLYILVYYIIGGLYAGVFACFGLAVSLFLKNRYIILFIPQILYLAIWFFLTFIGLISWDPFNFLDPKQPITGLIYSPFIIVFIIIFAVSLIIYLIGVKKNSNILS